MIIPGLSFAQDASGAYTFMRYAEKLRDVRVAVQKGERFSGTKKENTGKIQKIVLGDDAEDRIEDFAYSGFITYFSTLSARDNRFALAFDLLENLESPMEIESMQRHAARLLWGLHGKSHPRFRYEDIIAPLSVSRNAHELADNMEITSFFVSIPGINREAIRIPRMFAALGLYDKAWRAYREHSHVTLHGVNYAWSPAHHWKLAAENAYLAGEKQLGWQLLMKAAVFRDDGRWGNRHWSDELLAEIKETAELWWAHEQSGKELPRPEILQGDARREAWNTIIGLYQRMRAHPRAWALVDEYPDEFENPQELKQKIQEEWLRFVGGLIPQYQGFSLVSF